MAKLFLESTDTSYKVSNGNTKIFGATGDQALVIDGALTGIEVNSNVERVQFTGSTTDYTYKVVGTNLEVYAAGALVSTIGVQTDTTGTQLTFANGTVDAKITGLNAATIGGTAVSSTAAAAVVPTTIDATVSSAPAPVFSVSAPVTSVTESATSTASFTVSLNAAQPAASSVSFALGNVGGATTADYGTAALTAVTGGATLTGSVLTFPAGITTATITVPVTNDSIVEATGDGVSLTLSAPSTGATLGTSAAQVLIVDGVPATPTFSLSASATSAAEGTPAVAAVGTTAAVAAVAAGTITLTVTRTGATTATDTVVVQSTAGTGVSGASTSDFTAISQTVSFAPGETVKTVTFTPVADSTREGDETLTVALGSASAGSAISTTANSVTLTITNDDANLLPVLTTPTTTPSAFIGSTATAISGISFTDGDDNTGFSVTVQAAGTSQVSFSSVTATGAAVKNATGAAVIAGESANTLTITGAKDAVNTILGNLGYTSNSTVPTSESVIITVTDAAGGIATKTLAVNIGKSGALTSGNDSLLGSAGDDQFTGALSVLATTDTIDGGLGNDKLTLTTVTGTVPAAVISNVEVLDLSLTGNTTVTASTTSFGSALTTVNAAGNFTLGGTFNAGTTFNYTSSTATNTLTVSAINGTAGSADAFTVNLGGGVTLASIAGSATSAGTIDALTINSNGSGTQTNTVSTLATLTADGQITLGGTQALTLTLPNLDYGVITGANASGKLTVDGALVSTTAGTQFAIIGGSAGDALTGGTVATSITGGAGNDTIVGGAAVDTITGGTGADSLTGAAGNDVFVFAAGDSLATARDTIADLAEGDKIMFGTALTGLTNAATLGTTGNVRIDTTNSRLVVGTDEITIPASVTNATFTYSYGADSVVGTADDYITVGAAPFSAANNALGTLTLTGKSIATATVVLDGSAGAVTVNGLVTGSNAVNTITAATVTTSGVTITATDTATTGTVRGLTITDSAQNDTFNLTTTASAGTYVDTINVTGGTDTITKFGSGVDVLKVSSGATANVALVAGTPSWAATASTTNAGTVTIGTGGATTTATVDLSLVTTNTGTFTIDMNTTNAASGATTLKGAGAGVTHIIGGSAVDTITAAVGGGSITGGAGADVITAGAGVDTIVAGTATSSIVASADTTTAGGLVAGETFTFATGVAGAVDRVIGFVSGTDKLDVATATTAPTTLIGVADATVLTNNTTYAVYGSYAAGTGVFTTAAAWNATTAPDAMVVVGNGVLTDINHTGYVVLTGLNQALVAADFV